MTALWSPHRHEPDDPRGDGYYDYSGIEYDDGRDNDGHGDGYGRNVLCCGDSVEGDDGDGYGNRGDGYPEQHLHAAPAICRAMTENGKLSIADLLTLAMAS